MIREYCEIDRVPDDVLMPLAFKTYVMAALAWDYIDTVLDLCAAQRVTEAKELCREVRAKRLAYDRFRQRSMDRRAVEAEMEGALGFEEECRADLRRLGYSLRNELTAAHVPGDMLDLAVAVQTALTAMDTVAVFSRSVDATIASYRVHTFVRGMTIVEQDFIDLFPIVPRFPYGSLRPSCRELTARILSNRLMKIPLGQ